MSDPSPLHGIWAELGLSPTGDQAAIRRAYAARLKHTSPEDDPKAFQRLREAYERAREQARYWQEDLPEGETATATDDAPAALPDEASARDGRPLDPAPEPAPEVQAAQFIAACRDDSDAAILVQALEQTLASAALASLESQRRFEDALQHELAARLPVPLALIDAALTVWRWHRPEHRYGEDGRWLRLEARIGLAQAEQRSLALVTDWSDTLDDATIEAALRRQLADPWLTAFDAREHFERRLLFDLLQSDPLPISLVRAVWRVLDWDDGRHPLHGHAALDSLTDRLAAFDHAQRGDAALKWLEEVANGQHGWRRRYLLAQLRQPPKPLLIKLLRQHRGISSEVGELLEQIEVIPADVYQRDFDIATSRAWYAALSRPSVTEPVTLRGLAMLTGLSLAAAGAMRESVTAGTVLAAWPLSATGLITLALMAAITGIALGLLLAGRRWNQRVTPWLDRQLARVRGSAEARQRVLTVLAAGLIGSAALPSPVWQLGAALLAFGALLLRHGRSVWNSALRGLLPAGMLLFGLINALLQDEAGAGLLSVLLATTAHAESMPWLAQHFARRRWPADKAARALRRIDIAWWLAPLLIIVALTARVLWLDPAAANRH